MDSAEYIAYLIVVFFSPVAAFVAGWVIFTAGRCLIAALKRQPVAPVIKEMLEEW